VPLPVSAEDVSGLIQTWHPGKPASISIEQQRSLLPASEFSLIEIDTAGKNESAAELGSADPVA